MVRYGALLLLGGGSYVANIASAIAQTSGPASEVTIVASSAERVSALADAANDLATRLGNRHRFVGTSLDWNSSEQLAATIAIANPACIVHAASLQSAWTLGKPDRWSALVQDAGYGATLIFQMAFMAALRDAVIGANSKATLVNACFPDVANAAARLIGLEFTCGIGNIALIADVVGTSFPHITRILAGHVDIAHLGTRPESLGPLLGWTAQNEPVELSHSDMSTLPVGPKINRLNGLLTAPVLLALAQGGTLELAHLPGPLGLQGGYPCRIAEGALELALADVIAIDQAAAWHRQRLLHDGAWVEGGRIWFSEPVVRALPAVAYGVDASVLADVADDFFLLRERLMTYPG